MDDIKHTLRKAGSVANKNDNKNAIIWRNRAAEICLYGSEYTAKEIIGMILDNREPTIPGGRVKSYRWAPTPMKLTAMLRRDDRFAEVKKQTVSLVVGTTTWVRTKQNKSEARQSACLYAGTGMSVCSGAEGPTNKNKNEINGDEKQ